MDLHSVQYGVVAQLWHGFGIGNIDGARKAVDIRTLHDTELLMATKQDRIIRQSLGLLTIDLVSIGEALELYMREIQEKGSCKISWPDLIAFAQRKAWCRM